MCSLLLAPLLQGISGKGVDDLNNLLQVAPYTKDPAGAQVRLSGSVQEVMVGGAGGGRMYCQQRIPSGWPCRCRVSSPQCPGLQMFANCPLCARGKALIMMCAAACTSALSSTLLWAGLQLYDNKKALFVINQINGRTSNGTKKAPVPTIFGKLKPDPCLSGRVEHIAGTGGHLLTAGRSSRDDGTASLRLLPGHPACMMHMHHMPSGVVPASAQRYSFSLSVQR